MIDNLKICAILAIIVTWPMMAFHDAVSICPISFPVSN